MIRERAARARRSSPSGTSRGRTRSPSASARGARSCSRACSAATILGFHTQFHCNNFVETVDRYLEARIDRETFTISYGGRADRGRALSDLDRVAAVGRWPSRSRRSRECRAKVHARATAARRDVLLGVGVDRIDYTKGILERFHAVERLLELEPDWHRPLRLRADRRAVALAASSEYQNFEARVRALAERINAPLRAPAATSRSCCRSSTTSHERGLRVLPRRRRLRRHQPARRHEPGRQGVRRRARRRARRAGPRRSSPAPRASCPRR